MQTFEGYCLPKNNKKKQKKTRGAQSPHPPQLLLNACAKSMTMTLMPLMTCFTTFAMFLVPRLGM